MKEGAYSTFFPASFPGVHSNTSVIFMMMSDFAGYLSLFDLIQSRNFS